MKGLTTILLASSTTTTASAAGGGGIPQHRVKTSTRILNYGNEVPHPLSRYSNPANHNNKNHNNAASSTTAVDDVTSSRVLEEESWIPFVDSTDDSLFMDSTENHVEGTFDTVSSTHLRTGKMESESRRNEYGENKNDVSNLTSDENGGSGSMTSSSGTATDEVFENGERVWSISSANDNDTSALQRRAAETVTTVEAAVKVEETNNSNFWRGETRSPLPPPHNHGGTTNQRGEVRMEGNTRRKMRLGDGGGDDEEEYVLWENEVVEEGDGYALGVEVENKTIAGQGNNTIKDDTHSDESDEVDGNSTTTQEIIGEVEDEDRVTDLLMLDSFVNETLVDSQIKNDTTANATKNSSDTTTIIGTDHGSGGVYLEQPSPPPNDPSQPTDNSDLFIPSDSNNAGGDTDKDSDSSNTSQTTDYTQIFESMRIKAFLGDESGAGKFLTLWERKILLEDILAPAIQAWSDALRVIPIQGTLTVDRNQLFDGVSCGPGIDSGLPSVLVPKEHMRDGVEEADLVLYLSLGFHTVQPTPEEEVWQQDTMFDAIPTNNDPPIWEYQPTDGTGSGSTTGDGGVSAELSSFSNSSLTNSSMHNHSSHEEDTVRCRPVHPGNSTNATIISNYTDINNSSLWNETDSNSTIIESNETSTNSSDTNMTDSNYTATSEEDGFNSTVNANTTDMVTNNSTDDGINGTVITTNSTDNSTVASNDTNVTTSVATTATIGPTTVVVPSSNSSSLGNETNSSMVDITNSSTTGPTLAPDLNATQQVTTAPTMGNYTTSTVATTMAPFTNSSSGQSSNSTSGQDSNSTVMINTTTKPTVVPNPTTGIDATTGPTEASDAISSRNGGTYATHATISLTTSTLEDSNAIDAQESNSTNVTTTNESQYSTTSAPVSTATTSIETSNEASANNTTTAPTVVSNGNSSQSDEANSNTANFTSTYPTATVSNPSSTEDPNSTVMPNITTISSTSATVTNSSIASNDTTTSATIATDSNTSITSKHTTTGPTVSTDSNSLVNASNDTTTSPTVASDSNSSVTSNNTTTGPTVANNPNSSLGEGLNPTNYTTQVPDFKSPAFNTTTLNNTSIDPTSAPDSNSSISHQYNSSELVNATFNNNTTNSSNSSFPEDYNSTTDIVYQEDDSDLPPCEVTDGPSPYPTLQPSSSPSTSPTSVPTSAPTEEQPPLCLGDYLASATYCSTDQFDRPIAGMMNICIGDDFFNPKNLQKNIIAAIHEIGHVLGFNPVSLAHFRARDGTPLTPRDRNGDVPDVTVECTGPAEGRSTDTIPLPSDSILQFENVRGGVRVANVVTPTVAQVVRNQFDCQKLVGGELESPYSYGDDAEGRECIGGHWSRRLFASDIMNPDVASVEFTQNISPLTLALMADSGWYQVDLAHAAFVSTWGRRAGCDFVEEKCVSGDGGVTAPNAPFFCNDVLSSGPEETINEIHGCTADLSRKAVCSIVRYNENLPKEYDYFDNVFGMGSKVGGSDPGMDFCPAFSGFSNGLCKDGENEQFLAVHSMEEFGQRNSRCVVGQVRNTRTALCLPIACVISDRTLRVKVDGYWKVCRFQGQIISGWWDDDDYIVCPDPSRVCPTFYCSRNCLGTNGGVCDYETGKCMCESTDHLDWQLDGESPNKLVPCDENNPYNWHFKGSVENDLSRVESSLSEYYVTNSHVLKDNSKDIFDEVSRAFTKMSTGDAIVFVTSCVVAFFFLWFFVWRMRWLWKKLAYKSKNLFSWFFRRRISDQGTQPRDANRRSPGRNHHSPGRNSQKDKMVASLVVNLRVNDPCVLERFRRGRKYSRASRNLVQKNSERIVYQSELPPLPEEGSRVVAVVGSQFIQDGVSGLPERISDDDVSIGQTEATITTSVTGSTSEESIAQYNDLCFSIEEYTPQYRDLRRRPANVRARPTDSTTYLEGGKTTGLDT